MAKSKQIVLVVAAHPDDEVLGCGATMAKHAASGDEVHVLILAEGLTSRDDHRNRDAKKVELSALAKSALAAGKILGVKTVTLANFPDNRMDGVELLDVVKTVEAHVRKIKPQIIYTHHFGDVNIDHRVTHEAVITACRPQPGFCVREILFFEVPSSTEWRPAADGVNFNPNYFVDVKNYLAQKQRALHAYKTEMRSWPHPRSKQAVEHLARWRGTTSGFFAAEAFSVGRVLK